MQHIELFGSILMLFCALQMKDETSPPPKPASNKKGENKCWSEFMVQCFFFFWKLNNFKIVVCMT